jgi:hypothetical protein
MLDLDALARLQARLDDAPAAPAPRAAAQAPAAPAAEAVARCPHLRALEDAGEIRA